MSSLRSTSLSVMRPPKPPCWRDFVVSTPKSINSEGVDVTDSSVRTLGARSPVADLIEASRGTSSLPGNKLGRLTRRPRARIHRTRSEHVIHAEDLPESAFTATLADAEPKGVRMKVPDGRLYVEENNRRCQTWLASIEAAEPLDEVDYTADHQPAVSMEDGEKTQEGISPDDLSRRHLRPTENDLIPIHEFPQGVDVEIPEETFIWDVSGIVRQQSPSSGEDTCSACKNISHLESNRKSSGTSPCSGGDSHKQQGLAGNVIKNKSSADCDTGERHIVENTSSKLFKCGKTSCGKKLYKLCCDHQDTQSLSYSHNGSPVCVVHGDTRDQNTRTHAGNRVRNSSICATDSPIGSPSPPRARSSTRRYSRKLLSDSELRALNA